MADKETPEISTIGAAIVNDLGQLLPYTVRSYASQTEEWAKENWPFWEALKAKGARVVQVEIRVIE